MTVVEVIGELPAGVRQLISIWGPLLDEDPQELVVRERQERLAQCIESLRQQGVQGETKVRVGTPFLEVTREVLRHGHDLVMMTAEGSCGFKERLLGATSMHLMRKCPCPVWVVKPAQYERYARILAAVDTDPDDGSKDALNGTIMDLATSLAQLEQSELHVVHAWTMLEDVYLRHSPVVPADQLARQREVQDKHETKLDQLLGRYELGKLRHAIHLRKGEAAAVIPLSATRNRSI